MSNSKIKITMLGDQGVGKTCYMVSMYAFMLLGINGFTFSEKDLDRDFELTDMWEALVLNGKWPEPNTENIKEYNFDLSYGFRPILEVDFIDYRGNLLTTEIESKRKQKSLQDYLQESSCLLYFLSGEYLQHSQKLSPTIKYQIQNLDEYLAKSYQKLGCSKPVAIIVTKYDLCQQLIYQEIVANIRELFSHLFSQDSDCLVMVCPVTLGLNLAKTSNNEEIEPMNMHIPIAFALYSKLGKIVSEPIDDKPKTFIDCLWTGHLTGYDYPAIYISPEEQESQREKAAEIRKNMILLFQEIPKGYIFLGEKEVNINGA